MPAHNARACLASFSRRVDDGAARQLAAHIEAQMAPAMAGPVQAGGDPLDGRRIHDVDGRLETMRQPTAAPAKTSPWDAGEPFFLPSRGRLSAGVIRA